MSGLATLKCPECAYEATEEEMRLAERRVVFLEMTAFGQWRGLFYIAAALIFTFSTWRVAYGSVQALLILQAIWSLSVSSSVGMGYPKAYRVIVRRCVRLLLPWYCAPILVPMAALVVYSWLDRSFYWGSNSLSSLLTFAPFTIVIGFLVGIGGWYKMWPRLMRASGMPSAYHERARVRRFIRLAMWPIGFIGLGAGTLQAMLAIIDSLSPHWWR